MVSTEEGRRETIRGLQQRLLSHMLPYKRAEALQETQQELLAAWTHEPNCHSVPGATTDTPRNENHK